MAIFKNFPSPPNYRLILQTPACFNCQLAYWGDGWLHCEKYRLIVSAQRLCDDWQRNPNMATLPEKNPDAGH